MEELNFLLSAGGRGKPKAFTIEEGCKKKFLFNLIFVKNLTKFSLKFFTNCLREFLQKSLPKMLQRQEDFGGKKIGLKTTFTMKQKKLKRGRK